ncbi:MAG: hydrogenase maturation protease [Thermoanaerobaculia bacterium]
MGGIGGGETEIRVLGLGNVLMGDDAAGPWVVEHLRAGWDFGPGVSVTDLGTPGLDLVPHLSGARIVVLVDTVKSDAPPGTLRLYRRDEVLKHPPSPRTSPHDPAVKETLLYLELAGSGPEELLLVGIVPGSVEKGLGLTPAVAAAVPRAADAVLDELRRLGVAVERRKDAAPAAPWWAGEERAPS